MEDKWWQGVRNDRLVDPWSGVHLVTAIFMGWLMNPFVALVLLIAWEPLEILVLNRLARKWFGIEFGYETWRNSMSDVFFDTAGVVIGAIALRRLVPPPFEWFANWIG